MVFFCLFQPRKAGKCPLKIPACKRLFYAFFESLASGFICGFIESLDIDTPRDKLPISFFTTVRSKAALFFLKSCFKLGNFLESFFFRSEFFFFHFFPLDF